MLTPKRVSHDVATLCARNEYAQHKNRNSGIAGLILTVGMPIDANVIIFERIREELRKGKTPKAAIDGGYDRALTTIIDANVTTLIAALVLWQFGTGPIKGFATVLFWGILISMFTAIFVTRTIFNSFTGRKNLNKLSI